MSKSDVVSPSEVVSSRAIYPSPFGTPAHLLYVGYNLAAHGISWGFVFVWTTFFGLLRDGKDVDEFLVWGVGALFFAAAGIVVANAMRNDPFACEVSKGVAGFYTAAAFCTIGGGTCRD